MFGEDKIVGEKQVSIDEKRRITVPKFTFAEPGDKVGFMFDVKKQYVRLYKIAEFNKKLEDFVAKIDELRKEGKISFKEYMKMKRYVFGCLCIEYEEIKKGSRITIPERVVSVLDISDSIYVVGNDEHLDIYNSYESYQLLKK